MAMALETLEDVRDWHKQMASVADMVSGEFAKQLVHNNQKAVEIIDAHLSAQAKVRVPDGLRVSRWISDPNAFHFEISFNKTLLTVCDVESTDEGEHADFLRELAKAMLTAAPQPPEGARVVPDGWMVVYRFWDGWPIHAECQTGNQRGPLLERIEDMRGQTCTKCGRPMLAAPTLAGKEGAK